MRAEADYSTTAEAMGGPQTMNDADKRLRVTFSLFPHINQAQSALEGRPIYDMKEYIMIMVPGDRDIVHRPAWENDYNRFPLQYAAFKNKTSQDTASGTPLNVITWLTAAQIKELEYFNCYTVEQLATLSDAHATKFMGIQTLKVRAKDFLQAAKDSAPLLAIREEIDKKDAELAAANNALKEQGERIAKLEAAMAKAK